MNYAEIVKNRIVLNKVTEYFNTNPTKESVIIKAAADDNTKVFWRAVREGANRYRITEVKTDTDTFVIQTNEASSAFNDLSKTFMDAVSGPADPAAFANALRLMSTKQGLIDDPGEQQRADAMLSNLSALAKSSSVATKLKRPMGQPAGGAASMEHVLREASPAFQQASSAFTQAASSFDHAQMSQALKKINGLIGQITDPTERQNAGIMLGTLTKQVDATTAGGGHALNLQAPQQKQPVATAAAPAPAAPGPAPAPGVPTRKLPRQVRVPAKVTSSFTRSGKVVRESSPEFQHLSTEFVKLLSPPYDHVQLSNFLRKINQAFGTAQNPKDKENIGYMIGTITHLVDATTAGGGSPINTPPLKKQNSSRTRSGKRMSENSGKATQIFVAAMTPPFDHKKIVAAYRTLSGMRGQAKDTDKQTLELMTGELARMADQTNPTKQIAEPPKELGDQAPNALNTSLARFGNKLMETEKKKTQVMRLKT